MRFTTYSKYHPELADAVNLQGLLDQLGDFLLQSGFAGGSPSFWHDDMPDGERSMDALKQAILQALMDSGQLNADMLKVLRGETTGDAQRDKEIERQLAHGMHASQILAAVRLDDDRRGGDVGRLHAVHAVALHRAGADAGEEPEEEGRPAQEEAQPDQPHQLGGISARFALASMRSIRTNGTSSQTAAVATVEIRTSGV